MKRILFIDRDGTLIEEPADEQIDSFEKLKFVDGVFRNLSFIREKLDFEFVSIRTSLRIMRLPANQTSDWWRSISIIPTTT